MRNGQNKRMRGRNRNHKSHHSGGGGGGGGGGHHHNPLTRVYESNGPEVKIRGTAHHIAEKYLQLARDAQGSGDPVTAENYFQHAEHYLRLIAAAQEQFRPQNPYYQAPPAPGDDPRRSLRWRRRWTSGQGQPGQGQPTQGQPPQSQPNFGSQQQNFSNPQNYNNASSRPIRRASSRSLTAASSRIRTIRAARSISRSSNQPYSPPPQQYQPQPRAAGRRRQRCRAAAVLHHRRRSRSRARRTPQPNGYDNQGGDRFPRHRRRRHRGPRRRSAAGPAGRAAGLPRRRRSRRRATADVCRFE